MVAWLSLDESDRDPVRLWTGILAALDTVAPGVTSASRAALTQRGSIDETIATLLVDLEQAGLDDAVLVLDDVHLVDDVVDAVTSIANVAKYLPASLHLVLIGRRRLGLPMDRLRARGRLREVSFEELQFSPAEAAQMLTTLAPGLDASIIGPTTTRAAGWAASLQLSGLAARSSQARADAAGPVDADRLTEDYLWHEVLSDEPTESIQILHAASLVERVNGDLARAITGRDDAAELLQRAGERGLFLMRLSEPGWYAQHALVRELLLRDLAARSPQTLAAMHAAAARWYEQSGEAALAVRHWLRSSQPREALRTVAVNAGVLYDQGQESVVVQAIGQLPADLVAQDIESAMDVAWAHVVVDRRVVLDTVDRIAEMTVGRDFDDTTTGRLLMLRSIAAIERGEWDDAGDDALHGLARFGDASWQDHLGRVGWNLVARHVALTERWSDDLPDVRQAARMLEVDPQRRHAFEGTRALGLALHGKPDLALTAVAGMAEASNVANKSILSLELSLASALAHRERGDREAAMAELTSLVERPMTPLPYVPFLAGLALAENDVANGHLEEAETNLAVARRLMTADFAGRGAGAWVDTVETLVAVAGGQQRRAEVAAGRIVDPVWSAVSRARVRLAVQDKPGALQALRGVQARSVRQQVVLDLLTSRAAGSPDDSLAATRRAAQLAAEHGLLQTVVAEAGRHAAVWERFERVADAVPATWLDRLRRVTAANQVDTANLPAGASALTERERDVLRMLPSRLTVSEIADELHLSTNTVKFHLKVIYRKLNASSRAEAAAVARALTRIDRRGQSA